jgi:filamentous hemagglutinin
MVKLPNAERAVINEQKLKGYLLSRFHPIGRFKAAIFARAVFGAENSAALASQLRELALRGQATPGESSAYGQKYLVSGTLTGPAGLRLEVTSVWIVPAGSDVPRLVTAYPR